MDELPSGPTLTDEDVAAVLDVLKSNRLSQLSNGVVDEFENAISSRHGGLHAIAVSTGTTAIHLALCALDIGPGDEVIVPTHTHVGSASPIVLVGATPVFADIDPRTHCIDPASVAKLMTGRTRAVIVVHINGCAADIGALQALTTDAGVDLIEDCAQALGTRIGDVPVGVTGELSTFSFFEQKMITTGGEGGLVLTANDERADRIRRLRSHGEGPDGGRFLWSQEIGFSYRMTAMQAALGLSQLKRLDALVDARRANAAHLTRRLDGLPGLELPVEPPGTTHSFWRYVVRSVSRPAERLMDELRAEGVPVMIRYPYPVHRQPAFAAYAKDDCPVAERLAAELLRIPADPWLRPEHLDAIADRVIAVLDR